MMGTILARKMWNMFARKIACGIIALRNAKFFVYYDLKLKGKKAKMKLLKKLQ